MYLYAILVSFTIFHVFKKCFSLVKRPRRAHHLHDCTFLAKGKALRARRKKLNKEICALEAQITQHEQSARSRMAKRQIKKKKKQSSWIDALWEKLDVIAYLLSFTSDFELVQFICTGKKWRVPGFTSVQRDEKLRLIFAADVTATKKAGKRRRGKRRPKDDRLFPKELVMDGRFDKPEAKLMGTYKVFKKAGKHCKVNGRPVWKSTHTVCDDAHSFIFFSKDTFWCVNIGESTIKDGKGKYNLASMEANEPVPWMGLTYAYPDEGWVADKTISITCVTQAKPIVLPQSLVVTDTLNELSGIFNEAIESDSRLQPSFPTSLVCSPSAGAYILVPESVVNGSPVWRSEMANIPCTEGGNLHSLIYRYGGNWGIGIDTPEETATGRVCISASQGTRLPLLECAGKWEIHKHFVDTPTESQSYTEPAAGIKVTTADGH